MDSYYWYEKWLASQDEEFAKLTEEQKEYWESLYEDESEIYSGTDRYGELIKRLRGDDK